MIVRCPQCGTGHAVRYEPGRSPRSQRCVACGSAFAFFPALEIELVGLPRDSARMEPVPPLPVPIPRTTSDAERPAPPRRTHDRRPAAPGTRTGLGRPRDWALRVGGLLVGTALIVALVVQFLIHERATLETHPELAALSDALCRNLSCPDLRHSIPGTVQVRDLELEIHAQGWLRVNMLLTNTLDRAQPWPILELALSDRFGRRIAQARWEPREYLGPGAAARMLEPGEVRRMRLVVDRPAGEVEGVSVQTL